MTKLLFNKLRIGEYFIEIISMELKKVRSSKLLFSPIVVIKGKMSLEEISNSIKQQIGDMEINASFKVEKRRIIIVRDKKIIGYSFLIGDLSEKDSIRLQENGIGGRLHFGAGFLKPIQASNLVYSQFDIS